MTHYKPRLGYTIDQIRSAHRVRLKMSYGQVEEKLFERDYGRKPTWRDYFRFLLDEDNRAEGRRCDVLAQRAVCLR